MRAKVALIGQKTKEVDLGGTSSTIDAALKTAEVQLKSGKEGKDQVLLNGEVVTDMNTKIAEGAVITVVPNIKGGC